jgi:hypothetical protein
MYDAAGAWGGTNPFPGTLFVLTHRTADQPARLFEGFDRDMNLEVAKVYSSPYATHVRYTVTK